MFVIITDSTADLDRPMREKLDVEYIKFTVTSGEDEYVCSLDWDEAFTAKQFYDRMRKGEVFKTTMIQQVTYESTFEAYLKEGKDVLSVCCSSGLSGSYNAARLAAESLRVKYPGRKLICVDALRSTGALAVLVYNASRLRAEGKTIEETARWLEDNRMKTHQFGTVNDLIYLKRCGRVTGMVQIMSKIFNIKPIIISNTKGENQSVMKVRGRLTSLQKLINLTKENIVNPERQTVFISHADCEEEARLLEKGLLEEVKCKDVYINWVNPTVGASTGPGMIGVFFCGKEVKETATSD